MALYALVSPDKVVLEIAQRDPPEGDAPAAHKNRWLPVEEMYAAYDPVSQVQLDKVETVLVGKVVWNYRVRAKTSDEVLAMRGAVLLKIKAEAERRIVAIMPEHQQRNALGLGVELITKHGPDPAGWPADMQATYAAVMAKWAMIQPIRIRSNELEASVPQVAQGIAHFDPLVGWE